MPSTSAITKGLSIRQRIMLGFLLLIIMSIAITTLNIYHLRDFHSLFKQHQQVSSDANGMLQVDADIAELQRQILAFSHTDRAGDISNLLALHTGILEQIAKLIVSEQGVSSTNAQLLKQLESLVKDLREKIESLHSQRIDREKMISEKLVSSFDTTDKYLHDLYDSVSDSHSKELRTLWYSQHLLATIQTYSAQYFNTHEYADKKTIQDTFKELRSDLSGLRLTLGAPTQQKTLDLILDNVNAAEQNFHTTVQADRNYLFLLNIVIAGETAEIATVSDELKKQFILTEHGVYETAEKQSAANERIAISASISGSLLAILIAFFIGKKISDPLISITNTFSKLANEENVTTIPGTERTDEIGRLANAANVFRETNRRTQDLLERTENFAAELKHREIALEQAVAKAQEASVAKSQFLANMSHELRTPMNAILGMLALLKKTALNARQTDYTQKSEAAARTLLSLLNDILDLSKAEAGKIELDPIPFSLDQLLQDLKVILTPLASNKDIQLDLTIAPELPRVYLGDALRLQQILINLGSNAIKFTQEGGVNIAIEPITNERNQHRLKFSVRDTGIGIAPENIVKIFTGFTQAEASTTRRFGGTGLGLAISQYLVSLMGGQLQVESEVGTGSLFYFTLELPELDETEIERFQATEEPSCLADSAQHLQGIKILLVEDNLTNQQIAKELLELEGAEVITANHGQEALDILCQYTEESVPFQIVLMDLQMPVMDGISATHAIRQRLNFPKLPIIAMTANAMSSDREACLNAGMNDHVGKPFDIAQLVSVLNQYASTPTSNSQIAASHAEQNDQLEQNNQLEQTGAPPHSPIPVATVDQTPKDAQELELENTVEMDIKGAIGRMGGNKDIYFRMALKFIQSLDKIPAELNALLEKHDFAALAKACHSLKGVSATFGFMQLSERASRAEKRCSHTIEHEQAAQLIADLCAAATRAKQLFAQAETDKSAAI